MPAGGGARACIADMPGLGPARARPRVPRYAVAATRVLLVCGATYIGRGRQTGMTRGAVSSRSLSLRITEIMLINTENLTLINECSP